MSKKKKEKKKVSAKREKYAKFKKDKPSNLNFSTPELTPEQQKQKQEDESKIARFLRFSKNRPVLSIKEKKAREKKK